MTKWKRFFDSWKGSVILCIVILGCCFLLPGIQSIRQVLFSSSALQPQDFWEIQAQGSEDGKTELIFVPYTFEKNTLFQALGERSCLFAAVNNQPLQLVFPGQSIKLKEKDQLHLHWLVDPTLTSQINSSIIAEQTLILFGGQLQEVPDHE